MAEDTREEEPRGADIREAVEAEEMVVATGEVEVKEAPEVAEGEAAEGKEDVVTNGPPLELLKWAARPEIDSWPGWPMRQSRQSLARHLPSSPECSSSSRIHLHRLPRVRSCFVVFLSAFCLTPGQPTAL